VLRPGRFDEKILVPLPDAKMRAMMLKKKLSGIPCEKISFSSMATLSEGFSGAEIELACEKAKQSVIRAIIGGASNDTKITENDVISAIKSVRI
jgi:SpoVK/Ycf46/Vps4 family AAA+-type ATPase